MTNPPKKKGTATETAVVRYLRTAGWPGAERRALTGVLDEGDITGTPGLAWEVKARKSVPSDLVIDEWMTETETERRNAGVELGVLVVRRPGVGLENARRWWAYLSAVDVATLVNLGAGFAAVRPTVPVRPVRLLLCDAVALLRGAGYGSPDAS